MNLEDESANSLFAGDKQASRIKSSRLFYFLYSLVPNNLHPSPCLEMLACL